MPRPNAVRRAGRVALHNCEGKYLRSICRSEAEELVELGHSYYVCRRCAKTGARGRCIGGGEHQTILRNREPERKDKTRHGDFGLTELEAVVGITRGEVGAPAKIGLVRAAQEKLAAWPFVGDTLAVRVGPRVAS